MQAQGHSPVLGQGSETPFPCTLSLQADLPWPLLSLSLSHCFTLVLRHVLGLEGSLSFSFGLSSPISVSHMSNILVVSFDFIKKNNLLQPTKLILHLLQYGSQFGHHCALKISYGSSSAICCFVTSSSQSCNVLH